ncbi:hypothetical protein K438DRAFT_1765476 [Mycena galopus ATCC 62051]|nr:hypothetical protein K438DRAFT_1765476 [Mycena galopus ATCC 62051]
MTRWYSLPGMSFSPLLDLSLRIIDRQQSSRGEFGDGGRLQLNPKLMGREAAAALVNGLFCLTKMIWDWTRLFKEEGPGRWQKWSSMAYAPVSAVATPLKQSIGSLEGRIISGLGHARLTSCLVKVSFFLPPRLFIFNRLLTTGIPRRIERN